MNAKQKGRIAAFLLHVGGIAYEAFQNPAVMAYCVQSLNAGNALDSISAEETHLRVLRLIEVNPEMSQRELAEALGVSLGKTNYCLRALLERGLIKVQNFRNSKNKAAYAYYLTPAGIRQKTGLTTDFLKRKLAEYEALKSEIDLLKREAGYGAQNDG